VGQVSVAAIIPLYNGAPFIRDALGSVLRQTAPADEIIVVDDGSTDNGAAIVESMIAEGRPIRLLRKANGGQSSARNLGVATCASSHIAFLDQDDEWYEDHLEILKQPFAARDVRNLGYVYGNLDQINSKGHMVLHKCLDIVPSPQPKKSLVDCLGSDMFILPSASLVAKEAFLAAGAFDERLSGYEDDDLFARLFMLGYRSVYLNVAVTKWRIHPASTSFSARMAVSRMIYFRKLIEACPDEPLLNVYYTRDVIGPRFLALVTLDFLQASRVGDGERMRRSWADVREVAGVCRPRIQRRLRRVSWAIERLYATRFTGIARLLLRRAVRSRQGKS
jgi:glycosyltransferase involved in cell wall biosynthesis